MYIDHDVDGIVDSYGLNNIHSAEAGRNGCTVHRWQVRHGSHYDVTSGVALTAIELGDGQRNTPGRFLLSLMGVEVACVFELHEVSFHRNRSNGFCSVEGHHACASQHLDRREAEQIWARVTDCRDASGTEVYEALRDLYITEFGDPR